MDDGQHVIGARRREGFEGRPIRDRCVVGAPRVERVADVAHRRQVAQDRRPGGIGNRRQVEPDALGEVGDQRRLAGGHRDHAGPPTPDATPQPVGAGDQLRLLEQLVEVVAADDPGGLERRVGHPVLPGQAAAVRDRRLLCLLGPADLDREDRLAHGKRPVGEREEPLGTLEPLDEQHDGVGLVVVQAVGEVVADVQHGLRADGHDPAVPDPRAGRMDERIGDAAGLGEAGDVPAGQPGVDVPDVAGAPGRPVDHAHAVRPQQRDAVGPRDLAHLPLHLGGRLASLDDAATRDHEAGHARVGCVLREPRRSQRVDGEDHGVRPLGQGVDRRPAG